MEGDDGLRAPLLEHSGMLECRRKETRGKREGDDVVERRDNCSEDGSPESGVNRIKKGGGGGQGERLEEDSSMPTSVHIAQAQLGLSISLLFISRKVKYVAATTLQR